MYNLESLTVDEAKALLDTLPLSEHRAFAEEALYLREPSFQRAVCQLVDKRIFLEMREEMDAECEEINKR